MMWYYRTNGRAPNYWAFPNGTTTFNSNSFAHGLLIAAGINSIAHHPISNVPGWEYPLPKHYFEVLV